MPGTIFKYKVLRMTNIAFAFMLFVTSCSNTDFSGGVVKKRNKADKASGDVEQSTIEREDLPAPSPEVLESETSTPGALEAFLTESFSLAASNTAVDVAFIVDMSSTMQADINNVVANLNGIMSKLLVGPGAKNIQVFLLAGRNDLSLTPPAEILADAKFSFTDSGHSIDSFNLLSVARDYLNGTLKTTKFNTRSDALKHIVFITDDQAKRKIADGVPAATSESEFRQVLTTANISAPNTVFHSITCFTAVSGCPAVGTAYQNIARDFKGLSLDLRSTDWSKILTELTNAINSQTDVIFSLSRAPLNPTTMEIFIDGVKIDSSKVIVSGSTVKFPAAVLPQGIQYDIKFK